MSEPVKVVLGPGAKPDRFVELPEPEPALEEAAAIAGRHRLEVDGE